MTPLQAAREGRSRGETMKDPFETFGPPELCTWRYGTGVCSFQTTSPQFARKLSQRGNARLVAWSVNKEYLRVFQEAIEPWRARRLVSRYLKATNRAFLDGVSHQRASKTPGRVVVRNNRKMEFFGEYSAKTHLPPSE